MNENEVKGSDSEDVVSEESVPEESLENAESEETAPSEEREELDPLEVARAEAGQLRDQLLRARADFENYRKRMARETERIRKTASETIVREILPVLDNLELAMKYKDNDSGSLADGVEMVARQLAETLERHGVKPIAAVGEAFDPNVHEAVAQLASDSVEKDGVVEEFQRGYMLHELVLRPSKVTVSAGPSAGGDDASEDESSQ